MRIDDVKIEKEDLNKRMYFKCLYNESQRKLFYNNPHCIEYFCTYKNVEYYKGEKCKKCFIYDHLLKDYNFENSKDSYRNNNIDKFKDITKFYKDSLIYDYDNLPYIVDYEYTLPKPKTIVHWGQLKMFLVILLFLVKIINPKKKYNIIYPGSAPGDTIHLLLDMFPNTNWYLIDPRDIDSRLHKHKQIKEIIKDYFTDDIIKKYVKQFKDSKDELLLISDIRIETGDEDIISDQNLHIKWHKALKPNYSYFKFRCPYEETLNIKGDKDIYNYYKGKIYIQPYAPQSSTETRLLLKKKLIKKDYNINEYQGKMIYHNRILRPSYYVKSIIKDNNYFDHCYDCTYFSYLIKNYINKFKEFSPFKTDNIYNIMKIITDDISKLHLDKIKADNANIKRNLFNS